MRIPTTAERRVILVFVISALAGIVLVGVGLRYSLQRAALAQSQIHLEARAGMLARQCDDEITEAEQDLEFVAKMPAFRQLRYVNQVDRAVNGVPEDVDVEKRQLLANLMDKSGRFSVLYVLQPNADWYLLHPFRVQLALKNPSLSDRPYYQEAVRTGKTVVSDSFLGSAGTLSVAILAPIRGDAGDVTGYLGGVLYLTKLSQFVSKEKVKPFDAGFLIDRQGLLIAHTDTGLLKEGVRERFVEQHPFIAAFIASAGSPTEIEKEEVFFGECRGPDGAKRHLTVLIPLRSGWTLGLMRDRASVIAEGRPVIWAITLLAGLLLAITSGLAVAIAHHIGQRWNSAERALRASEAELRETNEYLENLFNYANAPIIVWDPELKISRFNHAFEQLTGRRADDVIGKSIETLFPVASAEGSMELIRKTLTGERWETVEIGILHLDGSVRTVLWNSATILADDGKTPVATIAQGHDITGRKRTEDALREGEAKYRTLVENIPQKIFMKTRDYGFVSINNNFARDLGIRPEDVVGKTDYDLFPKELADKYHADDVRVMESGQTEEFEERYAEGGKETWVNTIKTPVRDGNGEIVGVLGVFWDITARKAAEAQLLIQSRIAEVFLTVSDEQMYGEVLKTILDVMQSPFGVFGYLDEEGALVVPSMTRHIWDKCQVPEKTFIFPRATWGDASWPRAIREKKPNCTNEVSTNIPEGHIGIRRHISFPILFQGEVIGLLQVANKETDYSEADVNLLGTLSGIVAPVLDARLKRERQEAGRKRALADLERSNKELEQFAYVASHDLQEPLRMVSSYSQLLAERYEGQLDEKAKKYIDYAVDGALRMQQLINDLLTYSRVGTRGKPLEPTDSHAVLGEVIRNLAPMIEENRALVTNDELPTLRADATQLVHVFQNLLSNAIKFRGVEFPRVHVSVRDEGREWVFSVRDNGIGIDSQYADRVFVIFQRLHTRQEYPGTGIGLAVCKRIVERHGGRIWFESEVGKGATFFFTVPKLDHE